MIKTGNILCSLLLIVLASCMELTRPNRDNESVSNKAAQVNASETYIIVDETRIAEFNKTIATKNITSPENIMIEYVGEHEGEGYGEIQLSEKIIDQSHRVITFIQVGIPDDSVLGRKIEMTLEHQNNQWVIVSIRKNFKCRENRGHQYWSATPCY